MAGETNNKKKLSFHFLLCSKLANVSDIEDLLSQRLNVVTRLSQTCLFDQKCPIDNGELYR